MHVGYARVSSHDQDLTLQRQRLAHCERLYEEKASGTKDTRPQLQACLDFVREGDTLVVVRLDRLARSTLHLCQIAARLGAQQVHLHVLEQQMDTRTPEGRFFFHMLAAVSQFETELRAERQREGITRAKRAGIRFGRRAALTPAQIGELCLKRAAGSTINELMYQYRVRKATIYRYLAQNKHDIEPADGQHAGLA